MITEIRHVGIVVSNLEKALAFWCGTLGFKIIKKMDEKGKFIDSLLNLQDTNVTTCKLSAPDGSVVELLHFLSHPDKKKWNGTTYTTGLTHLAFTVNNIQEEYERLSENGVTFFSSPQVSVLGDVKVAYASGPEGILLEFVQILVS